MKEFSLNFQRIQDFQLLAEILQNSFKQDVFVRVEKPIQERYYFFRIEMCDNNEWIGENKVLDILDLDELKGLLLTVTSIDCDEEEIERLIDTGETFKITKS